MSDMKRYLIKLTQTEAEALTYVVGGQGSATPILDKDMFNSLFKLMFNENITEYHKNSSKSFDTLMFTGF
jgi:hypothetical protein